MTCDTNLRFFFFLGGGGGGGGVKIHCNVNQQVYKFKYPNICQIMILDVYGTTSKVIRLRYISCSRTEFHCSFNNLF